MPTLGAPRPDFARYNRPMSGGLGRDIERARRGIGCTLQAIGILAIAIFVLVMIFRFTVWIQTPAGAVSMIIAVVLGCGLLFAWRTPEKVAAKPMGHLVKTLPVGDLASATGFVETCGRLRAGHLATPIAKLPAVWVHVVVEDPDSSDSLFECVLGDALEIYDDTGHASIDMKGAKPLMERQIVKTSEDSPDDVAEVLRTLQAPVDPGRSVRVREQWLAPDERVWVRGTIEATGGDTYRGGGAVSLSGVTIALEPLLSHAEAG